MAKPFALKACPRCRGDLMLEEEDLGPRFYVCIQCGRAVPGEVLPALANGQAVRIEVPAPPPVRRRPRLIMQ